MPWNFWFKKTGYLQEKGLVLERPFPYVQFASQEALTV